MQPSDDIEKRLRETPLPSLKDGLHRETLKQALLGELQKERFMTEKASTKGGEHVNRAQRRLNRRLWFGASAAVAIVVAVVVTAIWPILQYRESERIAALIDQRSKEAVAMPRAAAPDSLIAESDYAAALPGGSPIPVGPVREPVAAASALNPTDLPPIAAL